MFALTVGESGCLLGQHQVADDVPLLPPSPPSIIEDPNMTTPLPGAVLFVQQNVPVTFTLSVLQSSAAPLEAEWFLNRNRPCNDALGDCGNLIHQDISPSDGGILTVTKSLRFPTAGTCYRVDFYVSTGFIPFNEDPTRADQPRKTGESAHARWLVVTYNDDGHTLPSFNSPSDMAASGCTLIGIPDGQGH